MNRSSRPLPARPGPRHRGLTVAIALLLAIPLAGPASAQEADATVTMANFRYMPFDTLVRPGDTVEWHNTDTVTHTVTDAAGSFDRVLQPGDTFQEIVEAEDAPEVQFFCRFHGAPGIGQHGFLTVVEEGADPPPLREQPAPQMRRLEGGDAVDSAIAWTSLLAPGDASRVVLGRADDFADVLAAGATGLPLLLTASDALDDRVLEELRRLAPADGVVIAGGEEAVSADVAQSLVDAGFAVERIAGESRIETAAMIAARFFSGADAPSGEGAGDGEPGGMAAFAQPPGEGPPPPQALVARARGTDADPTAGFADSLGASAVAALLGIPVLLTDGDGLSPATRDHLVAAGIGRVAVVGGPAAVPQAVVTDLEAEGLTVQRVAGGSRVDTASALRDLALSQQAPIRTTAIVDGYHPDAWAQGFGAAALGSVVLLADGEAVPAVTQDALGGFEGTVLLDIFAPTDVVCAPGLSTAACDLTEAVVTTAFISPAGLIGFLESGNETGDAGAAGYPGTGITGVARSASGLLCYGYTTLLPGAGPGEPAEVVGAHIHEGVAGEAGDVVIPLHIAPDGEANGCLTDVDPALVDDIFANPTGYYVNVHTADFPAGAVRDNLFPFDDFYAADLSGDQEVPGPGDPMGVGVSFLTTNDDDDLCAFTLSFIGEPAAAAHVHVGGVGEAGPVLIPLTVSPIGAPVWGDCIEDTDPEALASLLAAPAEHYVNVHTEGFPDGAIRGQVQLQFAVPS